MALSFLARSLVCSVALASALSSAGAQAAHQKSWAERLGLISYEPFEFFYEDHQGLANSHSDEGPLQRFVPESARRINVYTSRFLDQVIVDYEFDESDWAFFRNEWEELADPADTDHVFAVFKTCPWKRPLPDKARYFRSVKEKMWDISGYVIIDEDSLHAWYYWSVPQPTRGSFCQ